MRNTIVWGLESDITSTAIQQLEKEGRISIKAWFGEKDKSEIVTHHCFDLQYGGVKKNLYTGCSEQLYSQMFSTIYTYIDMCSRGFSLQDEPLQEYLHRFNLWLDFYYDLFLKHNVDLILFANNPHEGPDYILYSLAKVLNVETIVLTQSLFPERFFYMYDVNEYGVFNDISTLTESEEIYKIDKGHKKELFYMKQVSKTEKFYKELKRILHVTAWAKSRIQVWEKSFQKYNGIKDFFEKQMYKRVKKWHLREMYKQRAKQVFNGTVDLSANFIYFPLHLQPELSTSALGGVYCDQLLALERLAAWIPDGWYIYAKENPKQTSFMRSKYFFERIKNIPKVRTVASTYNTYELIQNSKFVASIAGTAGWEAISGGKNALVFGRAWYRSLPGVFSYSEELKIDEILSYKINHEELQKQIANLLSKTAIGVVDPSYSVIVPDFDCTDNNIKIAQFFRRVIKKQASKIEKEV